MINIARADLLAALEAVKGAVATKTFQPILTHVLIDGAYVMGFDSEVGVKVKMPQDCGATFNVRFETLFNLMKSLSGDNVSFLLEGPKVTIRCGGHTSTLVTIQEAFPQPPTTTAEPSAVPIGFKEALERALIAASQNEQERVLSSVVVSGSRVMTTNRRAAVRCSLDPLAPLPTMVLGRKAVTELIRLGQPGTVQVEGAWSVWDYGNLVFVAALREGLETFPKLDDLMSRLGLPSAEDMDPIPDGLLAILQRLALFTGKDGQVNTRPTDMALELVARSETGDIVEYIDAKDVPRAKGFDPNMLATALPFSTKLFWGKTNSDPLFLRGVDADFEFILSPMVG